MRKLQMVSILVMAALLIVGFAQPVMADQGKININTASKKELTTLKGVGDKIADRIVEYRKDNTFKTIEEFMNVKGIGQKVFDKNKDLIKVKDE